MTRRSIEDQGRSASARIHVGRYLGARNEIGLRLDRDSLIRFDLASAVPESGLAAQRIILDGSVGGRIDYPSDQITTWAGSGCRWVFGYKSGIFWVKRDL